MKAKLFIGLAVAVVAIAAATVFAVNHFSPKSQMSDLTRANLEALTNSENINGVQLVDQGTRVITDDKGNVFTEQWCDCHGIGSLECPC
jgi:hypothetical protein